LNLDDMTKRKNLLIPVIVSEQKNPVAYSAPSRIFVKSLKNDPLSILYENFIIIKKFSNILCFYLFLSFFYIDLNCLILMVKKTKLALSNMALIVVFFY